MKAIGVEIGKKDSVKVFDIDSPRLLKSGAIIKTLEVGLDGTDYEINNGLYGLAPKDATKLVLGHEALGRVIESNCSLKVGALVVPTVRRACPQNCVNCALDKSDMCSTGDYSERGIKGANGYLRETFFESEKNLITIPKKLERVAVMLEPLSIAEKMIMETYNIQKRLEWMPKKALVLGAGPIGLFATMLLRMKGLNTWTVATRNKDSLKANIVETTGATYVNAKEESIFDLTKRIGGFDLVIEATGNSTVAFKGIDALAINGICCLGGVSSGDKKLEICSDCVNMKLVLGNRVVFGSVNSNKSHFLKAREDMTNIENMWPGLLERMITKRERFDEFSRLVKGKEDIKNLIEFL